jgi:5-formyltetrahydrofolate cyclo-ligase
MVDKKRLRLHFRGELKQFCEDKSQKITAEGLISKNLQDYLSSKQGYWAAFRAMETEPNLESLFVQKSSVNFVFPKIVGDSLVFFNPLAEGLRPWQECFEKNQLGILEPLPAKCISVELQNVSGFLVPGLAFDMRGGRLGRGRGFYDRVLGGAKQKVGVGFALQMSQNPLPQESFDIKMNLLVNEIGISVAEPELSRK